MSDNEAHTPSTAPAGSEGGERPLTNKEKRLLAVAAKRKAKEQAAENKSTSTMRAGDKRKRDDQATDAPRVDGQGEGEGEGEGEAETEGEVEVVSHKELRRRKKLAKLSSSDPAMDASSDATASPNSLMRPSHTAISSPASVPRSGFSIWVGNLSFFTAPSKLIHWFAQRGVDGISRVNMPKGARRAEMNRGFCYLDLPNKDMLTAAMNLSEQPLDGRKLLIKNGSDFTGRPDINMSALGIARTLPSATTSMYANNHDHDEDREREREETGEIANKNDKEADGRESVKGKTGLTKTAQKILRAQKNAPSMTLFLGNLSFNTTEQGVRDLFDHSASRRNPAPKKKEKKERKPRKVVSKKASSSSSSSSSSGSDSDSDSDSDSSSSSSSSSSSDSENNSSDSEDDDDESPSLATSKKDDDDEAKQSTKTRAQGEVVASAAGIRKVRLGTFEDAPTKCKGFGFIDFHTIEQATASLIDPRNTFLDGRKIVLQYASADATRRGASKAQKSTITSKRPNQNRVGFMTGAQKRAQVPRRAKDDDVAPVPGSFDPDAPLPKVHKETKEERIARRAAQAGAGARREPRRAKPGAALANAQRASTGIVQSTGTKISFDE